MPALICILMCACKFKAQAPANGGKYMAAFVSAGAVLRCSWCRDPDSFALKRKTRIYSLTRYESEFDKNRRVFGSGIKLRIVPSDGSTRVCTPKYAG